MAGTGGTRPSCAAGTMDYVACSTPALTCDNGGGSFCRCPSVGATWQCALACSTTVVNNMPCNIAQPCVNEMDLMCNCAPNAGVWHCF